MNKQQHSLNTAIVNDVTGLNPILVESIAIPHTLEEIQLLVKSHKSAISIGGGHFSMGGQTASEKSLHIDMRNFNKILHFNRVEKTITVQAGIRWREIQHFIDKHDLSIKIMQTYSNFTVGGSLSVNAHGRYIGQGPVVLSVKSLKIVLADGNIIQAGPTENSEIFYGAVGGYGGLGIIIEVTLYLANNTKLECQNIKLKSLEYQQYFFEHVRSNKKAIFHNADLYPPHYKTARAITWLESEKPLTVLHKIIKIKKHYPLEKYFIWAILSTPFGKWRRENIIDPILYSTQKVVWRNFEAGRYDVAELEPKSRKKNTFLLQEYFVSVYKFDEFLPKMVKILQRYNVNALNISVRHAIKDPGTLLAWAKEEVFAFVLYYKQKTTVVEKNKVAIWTRELIEAVISTGGTYYLPYQLHATQEQFLNAYPRAKEFFQLKKQLDPNYTFRNKLWDKYYLQAREGNRMVSTNFSSEFKAIFSDTVWSDRCYLFLQNIYRIYPEDKFHYLILQLCEKYSTDKEIYEQLQKQLPTIKPFLSNIRYALPALFKQKNEMAKQTLQLLGDKKINHYVEIGSMGRYVNALRKKREINGSIYLIDDKQPTYSPVDIMERGQINKLGHTFLLNNYDPISENQISSNSVDLVTCYIGLHHCPLDKLNAFARSIGRILKTGGSFIVRDHDVTTPEMHTFVCLIHTIFNAGLNIPWSENASELRHFTSIDKIVSLLKEEGFLFSGKKLLQNHDPSLNTLMEFVKA